MMKISKLHLSAIVVTMFITLIYSSSVQAFYNTYVTKTRASFTSINRVNLGFDCDLYLIKDFDTSGNTYTLILFGISETETKRFSNSIVLSSIGSSSQTTKLPLEDVITWEDAIPQKFSTKAKLSRTDITLITNATRMTMTVYFKDSNPVTIELPANVLNEWKALIAKDLSKELL